MLLVFHDAPPLWILRSSRAVYQGSALENCGRMYPNEPEPSEALARYEREHRAYMEGPFFREEGGVLFVEAREGRYLAAVKLYPWKEPGCWHVEALETRPEERGKGHGARVLGGAVRALEETGNVIVLSDVAKSNEASLRTPPALRLSPGGGAMDRDGRHRDRTGAVPWSTAAAKLTKEEHEKGAEPLAAPLRYSAAAFLKLTLPRVSVPVTEMAYRPPSVISSSNDSVSASSSS